MQMSEKSLCFVVGGYMWRNKKCLTVFSFCIISNTYNYGEFYQKNIDVGTCAVDCSDCRCATMGADS